VSQSNLKNLSFLETVGKATLAGNGVWRLLVLVLMALLLSNLCLQFQPLVFIAPVPLVIASLVYGKKTTLSLVIPLAMGMMFVGYLYPAWLYLATSFMFTIVFSVGTSFAFENKVAPYRAVTYLGSIIAGLVWGAYLYTTLIAKVDLEKIILEKLQEIQKVGMAASSGITLEELVTQIYSSLPIIFTFVPYLGAWIFVMLIVNNKPNWFRYQAYPYGMKDMMSFKTPYYFVYALVVGLGMGMAGHHFKVDELWTGAMVILNLLSAYYFFQGFGIFWDTLERFKVRGFFRTFLIFVVIIWAMMWVALIGLFDTWFDFRKLLENKMEGE
jgi:hypothetical protein